MEAGFFIRNEVNGHEAYQCPDSFISKKDQKSLNDVLTPVRLIISLIKIDILDKIWTVIDTYIDTIMIFQGILDKDYKGSSFCAGLLFGIHGSRMLIKIGKMIEDV